jgi:hypothetical protein
VLTSFGTAAEHYFYRPALGFFRAFMLEEYARAGIEFRAPVLDLDAVMARSARRW